MTDKDLLQRNESWEQAIKDRDPEAARDVLAADYALVLIHPVPSTVPLNEWIAMLPQYIVHEWEVEERVVDVSGDLAVILQRVRMRATVNGADRSGQFVISDVWQQQNGAWRVWRRHSTPLTAGALN